MSDPANASGLAGVRADPGLRPERAMLWAVAIAAVLLVGAVLPAEYGIDLTGIGRVIGLTKMGERKRAEAPSPMLEAKAGPLPQAAPVTKGAPVGQPATISELPLRFDEIDVKLAPGGEVEYKALLAEGELMSFTWETSGAKVTFDFHGEPSAGPAGAFTSFHKGVASNSGGSLRAPFAGTHGWWWKNATQESVVIKLRVSGFYSSVKRQ